MEFSERLRQLREKHGYTQKQLADAVHLSKNAICNYEKNVNYLILKLLCHLQIFLMFLLIICWEGQL
ncbi:MAG: helix-turn-helix domain-containing protein [Ruminiclostridium sp.]|nr:helix-turn-helix domain-containing protein [Ruminiclostridium sp.]